MSDDKRPLSWLERIFQYLFGRPPVDRRQSTFPSTTRPAQGSTKPKPVIRPSMTTLRPRGVTYSSTHTTAYSSGDTMTQPIILDQMARIENLADGLNRQADRFENAGDFIRSQELRSAAIEVRDSSNFAAAEAIVASVDPAYVPDNGFASVNDFSSTFDPAIDDPMGSPSYSDNS
jgi:hypothetical protein